jgi:opacity protein-like surface antigen
MKFKLAALCLLASSSAIAEDKNIIAGFNYTKSLSAEAKVTFEELDDEITEDLDISTLGLYLGYINEKNNRFIVSFSSANIDFDESNLSEDVTGLDLDWQFVYGEEKIKPYWGIGFGLHTIEDAIVLTGTNLDGDSLRGFSFQMMAGMKVVVNEQVEFDVSLQRKAYAWQSIEVTFGPFTETIDMTYAQTSLNLGAGFKF